MSAARTGARWRAGWPSTGKGCCRWWKLVERTDLALEELVDVTGRATIEAVLELSAMRVAGEPHRGRRGVKSPDRAESVMLAFAADPSELPEPYRIFARRIGEWRTAVSAAEAQGKPPPPWPYDGKALFDNYHRSLAEYRYPQGVRVARHVDFSARAVAALDC